MQLANAATFRGQIPAAIRALDQALAIAANNSEQSAAIIMQSHIAAINSNITAALKLAKQAWR
jgi:hypothetical protein